MYAIIATGGKQYKVSEGDVIKVEKLACEVGDTVEVIIYRAGKQYRVNLILSESKG